jgi:uncharacterized protein (DUF305 family)
MRRALTFLTAVLALAGCGTAAPQASGTAPPATAVAGPEHDAADVAFGRALIPHHRDGIALASSAARLPQARVLAEAIIATQRDEIVRMTSWLTAWEVPASPSPVASHSRAPSAAPIASPSRGVSASASASAASRASADSAEDAVRALIAHQEEAVRLAQEEQAKGANRAALAFARQVIESRTAEATELTKALHIVRD